MKVDHWKTLKSWLIKHKAIDSSVEHANEIKRLDLSNLSLPELPDNIGLLTELTVLNLSNNALSELPIAMASLVKLNNLDIRRNKFECLPEVLSTLTLGSLNASANKIDDITVLSQCTGLRVCDLSFNSLSDLGEGFSAQNNLRTLNLSGNFFKQFPEHTENLTKLQRLNLSQNMITDINKEISHLNELVYLDLSDNKITTVDEALFTLPIEELELSSNAIESIHLHGLVDLERLSLDENPLSSVELSEDFAPYLLHFSCDGCELDHFVEFSSTRLETLCFSANRISSIPETITQYVNLTQLDVENNNIQELPYSMTNMTRLQTLYIAGNPLSDEAKEVIKILHPDICDINMKTGVVIEKATQNDLIQMAELIGALFEIEKDFSIDFNKQLAGITKLYCYEGADLLVARHEGKVVGMVTMQRLISSAAGDYIGQIEDLIVHESYRKMGIGSRLINKIRFIALEEYGYKRVQLSADMDNTNALGFYTRRGFYRTNLNVFHLIK